MLTPYKLHTLGQLLVGILALLVPVIIFFIYFQAATYAILGTIFIAAIIFKLSVFTYTKTVPVVCSKCGGNMFFTSNAPVTFKCKQCGHEHVTNYDIWNGGD